MTAAPVTTRPAVRKPKRRRSGVVRFLEPLWVPVVLIAAWWFFSAASTSVYFPPLSRIWDALVRAFVSGSLLADIASSLANIVLGLVIGSVVAIALGIAIGLNERLRRVLDPVLQFSRALPMTALIPIVIGAFGIGQAPKVFLIAFACLWPVLLNTADGVRAIPPETRDVLRIYRAPLALSIRRAILPAAMPQIMAGIRVALAVAIALMVLSELFSSTSGVGFFIYVASASFNLPNVWVGTIIAGLLGYALSLAFILFERTVLGWYFESAGARD